MTWFRNHYICSQCDRRWLDEWSASCEDDCPYCGARHMSPYRSDDWTNIIEQNGEKFVILHSPETAEHDPEYYNLATFSALADAKAFIASRKR